MVLRLKTRTVKLVAIVSVIALAGGFAMAFTISTLPTVGQNGYSGSIGSIAGFGTPSDNLISQEIGVQTASWLTANANYGMANSSKWSEVFVSQTGQVQAFNQATHALVNTLAISAGGGAGIAVSSVAPYYVLVLNPHVDTVTVVNGFSLTFQSTTSLSTSPGQIVYDNQAADFYVAAGADVYILAGSSGSLSSTITLPAGDTAFGLAYDNAANEIYLAVSTSADVTQVLVISGTTISNTITGLTGSLFSGTNDVAYDGANQDVYVSEDNDVAVISGTSVLTNLAMPAVVSGVTYDPVDQEVYVASEGAVQLDVLSGESLVTSLVAPAGDGPNVALADSSTGEIWVTNGANDGIFTVQGGPLAYSSGAITLPGATIGGSSPSLVHVCATVAGCVNGDMTEEVSVDYTGQVSAQTVTIQVIASGPSLTYAGAILTFSDPGASVSGLGVTQIEIDLDLGPASDQTITTVNIIANS